MATRKPMGRCPHCEKKVRAVIVEENTVRRDVLECPKCEERLLVCMTPGCKDYAAGGDVYDENLCPTCTATGVDVAGKTATKAAGVVVGILVKRQFDRDD